MTFVLLSLTYKCTYASAHFTMPALQLNSIPILSYYIVIVKKMYHCQRLALDIILNS